MWDNQDWQLENRACDPREQRALKNKQNNPINSGEKTGQKERKEGRKRGGVKRKEEKLSAGFGDGQVVLEEAAVRAVVTGSHPGSEE